MKRHYWRLCVLILVLTMLAVLPVACGGDDETTTTAGTPTTAGPVDTAGPTTSAAPTTEASAETTLGGKDEIVIGAARPISGMLSVYEESALGPIYKLWVEEVNAEKVFVRRVLRAALWPEPEEAHRIP